MIFFAPTFAVVRSLIVFWPFALAMAGKELLSANKGAVLGLAWLIIRPLFQVVVIVTLVSLIFEVRVGDLDNTFSYGLYVLSGIAAWQGLQRPLEEAPSLIRDRMEMIKQVIYPVETLPVTSLLQVLVAPVVSLLIYLPFAAYSGILSWSVILLPIPFLLLCVLSIGLGWIMMIVGVLVKDLREIVSVTLGLLMYLSPVLLTQEMVGPKLWSIILLNPFAHVVIVFRDVLEGSFHPTSWGVFVLMAFVAFWIGTWVIAKAKTHINEYI